MKRKDKFTSINLTKGCFKEIKQITEYKYGIYAYMKWIGPKYTDSEAKNGFPPTLKLYIFIINIIVSDTYIHFV